jgi:hypothetical protein
MPEPPARPELPAVDEEAVAGVAKAGPSRAGQDRGFPF